VYSESPPLLDAEFSTQAPSVVFGALLIAIVFLLPGGFAGLVRQLSRAVTRAAGRMAARRTTPAPASDS
jgi:hypothetical protein